MILGLDSDDDKVDFNLLSQIGCMVTNETTTKTATLTTSSWMGAAPIHDNVVRIPLVTVYVYYV